MATSETSNLVETVTRPGLDAETWASGSTCERWTMRMLWPILPEAPGRLPATPVLRSDSLS